MNILQIDLEPWYCDLPFDCWDSRSDNVVRNVSKILGLLSKTENKATFFVLSDVAENHPELITRIRDEGHEIGSHGQVHKPLRNLTPEQFEEGLITSLNTLSDLGINDIEGYRAPQFSLDQSNSWAIDILDQHGFRYDSSIFPVKTPLYGVPHAPRNPYRISSENIATPVKDGIWEIPLSTYSLPFIQGNFPVAGGFYLRALPYPIFRRALKHINRTSQPAVCYLHPWELDPRTPRVTEYKWFHYYNIEKTEEKFSRLLEEFNFGTTAAWLNSNS